MPEPSSKHCSSHYDLLAEDTPAVDWQDIYSIITGDCQSHAMVRGFAHALLHPPEGSTAFAVGSVHRYRIKWRAKGPDEWLGPKT